MPPRTSATSVLLGVIGAAHGLKGEVRVRSFTDDPESLGAYGPLHDAEGNRYTVRSARLQKTVVVVRFEEVRDRSAAERLNGRELFVDRSALPEEEDEDDFYQSDLVGLSVVTVGGQAVGTLIGFHDFGAGEIAEIQPEKGPSVLIPFSQAAVPEIDIKRGVIVVEPFAAGLESSDPADDDAPEPGTGADEEASGSGGEPT
ncbi:ribosome maturation factor RimM [Mangrovicella endophytica]|uniref:ribosome maturation factor RimM n=1 Tax=Mangrovicella endophytica TaxID=2066697 RepID=UPI000C9DA7AE|nr:ribosome maturation factor RimM [Mangrovicella endophytica]